MIKLRIRQKTPLFEENFTQNWSNVFFYRVVSLHYQVTLLYVHFSACEPSVIIK